jgi:hypothetical protein
MMIVVGDLEFAFANEVEMAVRVVVVHFVSNTLPLSRPVETKLSSRARCHPHMAATDILLRNHKSIDRYLYVISSPCKCSILAIYKDTYDPVEDKARRPR